MKSMIAGNLKALSSLTVQDFQKFTFIIPAINLTLLILDNLLKIN